jgi:hypothetical protein
MGDPVTETPEQRLAARLVHAAELVLIEHTPGDEHTKPAARKSAVAVLRELAEYYDQHSLMGVGGLLRLAVSIEKGEQT